MCNVNCYTIAPCDALLMLLVVQTKLTLYALQWVEAAGSPCG